MSVVLSSIEYTPNSISGKHFLSSLSISLYSVYPKAFWDKPKAWAYSLLTATSRVILSFPARQQGPLADSLTGFKLTVER
jgi:hypothetical protein